MIKSKNVKSINVLCIFPFVFFSVFFGFHNLGFCTDMIRAGTIEITSHWTVTDQGLATSIYNLTDMKIVESLKIYVVFKKDRENNRVRVYELERAEVDFKYEWSGKFGMDGEVFLYDATITSPLQAKLKRELNPSECQLELYIDKQKNTYRITGKVEVKDIPFSAQGKLVADLKGITRHEETGSEEWTEDREEEIEIEGELDPEKKHVLKGKEPFYGAPGEFVNSMQSFWEGLFGGDVESTFSWDIRVPMVEIRYWEKAKNDWEDITSKTQDALVGKKIKLKAKVLPESANVQDGEWEIDGEIIKDYQASESQAKVYPIDSGDLKNPEVEFFWRNGTFEGDKKKVIYVAKVEGEEISGESTFNVFKPDAKTDVQPAGNIKIDLIADKLGGALKCEILPGPPGIAIDTEVQMPGKFSGNPYRFHYIQLIKTNAWLLEKIGYPNYEWKKDISNTFCLDETYPYTSEKRMKDHPGCPLSNAASAYCQMEMEAYIMFLPSGSLNDEECIWIPLKRVSWRWKGSAKTKGDPYEYPQPPCEAGFTIISSIPPKEYNPKAEDCFEHPQWSCCQKGYNWESTRIVIQNPNIKPPGWKDNWE